VPPPVVPAPPGGPSATKVAESCPLGRGPDERFSQLGRIVNISSLTVLGITDRTAYAAAKSALVSFSRSWALELAKTGITVNSVAPGPTETELFRADNPPGSAGEQRYLAIVPMGAASPMRSLPRLRFCSQTMQPSSPRPSRDSVSAA
jgi:NAD(P)-dependent dehydrogenase (short-subunit alcohol dehydrogenase family)